MKYPIFMGVALVACAALLLWKALSPELAVTSSDAALELPTAVTETNTLSPFDLVSKSGKPKEEINLPTPNSAQGDNVRKQLQPSQVPVPTINLATIDWFASRDDDQLLALAMAIRNDPNALQLLIDIHRQEPDAKRRSQLAALLGLVGGEQVTLLASELIFSGDAKQRGEGMDLLQAVQPGNAMARQIVSDMLATEVQAESLIDALTALASPGDVDEQSRAWLSEQVAWLTTHQEQSVRGISLDILSRWGNGQAHTDVFVAALDDSAASVRTAAAYALNGHTDNAALVIEKLFSVLNNSEEDNKVKRAAVLVLKSQNLNATQQAQLSQLELQVSRAQRR